jgi:hypothetical protein
MVYCCCWLYCQVPHWQLPKRIGWLVTHGKGARSTSPTLLLLLQLIRKLLLLLIWNMLLLLL